MPGHPFRGRFIQRPDQVEHHRWVSPPVDDRHRGLVQLDGPTRAMLHALHWRKPPRDPRRGSLALTITLLLHVFFLAVVWYEMKPSARLRQGVSAARDQGIQVRFITRGPAKPHAAPPLVMPAPRFRPGEPVSKNAMTVRLPASSEATPHLTPAPAASASAPHPVLFDRTGQIVLPAHGTSAPAAPAAGYVQHAPQGDTRVMQHRADKRYSSAPNVFQRYFPPPHESFVGGVMRKLNGRQSQAQSVDLPDGIHLKCQKVLGIPIPNCGMPAPPPPPTDGDARLNMAPAPLAKGRPSPKPEVAACIADYRAGKPLPHGCPVDTPARAVDAEKKRVGP